MTAILCTSKARSQSILAATEKGVPVSEIVRGRIGRHNRQVYVDYLEPAAEGPCVILPIEDGKVGGFEKEHTECLGAAIGFLGFTDNDLVRGLKSLRAAISRLFEEVESED